MFTNNNNSEEFMGETLDLSKTSNNNFLKVNIIETIEQCLKTAQQHGGYIVGDYVHNVLMPRYQLASDHDHDHDKNYHDYDQYLDVNFASMNVVLWFNTTSATDEEFNNSNADTFLKSIGITWRDCTSSEISTISDIQGKMKMVMFWLTVHNTRIIPIHIWLYPLSYLLQELYISHNNVTYNFEKNKFTYINKQDFFPVVAPIKHQIINPMAFMIWKNKPMGCPNETRDEVRNRFKSKVHQLILDGWIFHIDDLDDYVLDISQYLSRFLTNYPNYHKITTEMWEMLCGEIDKWFNASKRVRRTAKKLIKQNKSDRIKLQIRDHICAIEELLEQL